MSLRDAGRVGRVVVERVEVVEDGLDLGALDHPEPEAGEDVLDLAARLGQQVVAAHGPDRGARQRDVDAIGREALLQLAGLELRAAVGDEALERLAGLVGRLADAPALGGLELRDPAQEVRELRLAPRKRTRSASSAVVSCAARTAASASARSSSMRCRAWLMRAAP